MSKTVLITGASTGIGKAATKLFVVKGWQVIATMRSPEKVQDLPSSDRLAILRLDVTDRDSISNAIEQAIARFGKIDVLVNNAGYGSMAAFESLTPEQIQNQFATNVFGLFDVTRAILPHFRQQRSGIIINIASMGGHFSFPFWSVYHSTKWAVEGFSESLQYELEPFNIRVKLIEPGVIRTEFTNHLDSGLEIGIAEYDLSIKNFREKTASAYETGATPELVAKTIYQAATDNNQRLRYSVSAPFLTIRKLLPDRLFFAIMRQIMK